MRQRSASVGEQELNKISALVTKTILRFTNPSTGLLLQKDGFHSWVRDNVYVVHCVWALYLSYRKRFQINRAQYDKSMYYKYANKCRLAMRSLLVCFMQQKDKLERSKIDRDNKANVIHTKFNANTLEAVENDDYSHLQLDAMAWYLLTLAQLTSSGIEIIQSLEECSFVQNLIFYIEPAYRIPDYGSLTGVGNVY